MTPAAADLPFLTPLERERTYALSEEIWRQRQPARGEAYTLVLNSDAAEGLEKILYALAEGNFSLATRALTQLNRGLLAGAERMEL